MPRRRVAARTVSLADMAIVYGSAVAGGFAAYFGLYKSLGWGMIESVAVGTWAAVLSILVLTTLQTIIRGPQKKKMTDPLGEKIEWYK